MDSGSKKTALYGDVHIRRPGIFDVKTIGFSGFDCQKEGNR
jgi:hypothetical protein